MVFFSRRSKAEREAADRVYGACLNAARRPAFYLDHGVPDTFEGRFELLALTLFAVLNRLMHEPGDGPELARHISESFVEDMDAVLREMGVSDPGIPRRMKTLYGAFAGRVTAYRAALGEGDSALVDAVARNVFPGAPADKRSAILAEYLRRTVRSVADVDMAELRRGEIPFPEIQRTAGYGP
jgi:cytochrome b pre-mRNA-processing protein 3